MESVKIFINEDVVQLEKEVNLWLHENKNIQVVDRKMTTTSLPAYYLEGIGGIRAKDLWTITLFYEKK